MRLAFISQRFVNELQKLNRLENTEALYLIGLIASKSRGLNLAIDKEAKEKNVTSLGNSTTKQTKTKTTKEKTK